MANGSGRDIMNFVKICRKIVAVGRNYREHAAELGNVVPDKPLLFLKPPSSLLPEGEGPIKVPPGCTELHHEVELAIVIGKNGQKIPEEHALDHVIGYALALDMTARNFQDEEKKKGHPWTLSKCWDTFCPISSLIGSQAIPDPQKVNLWLEVDGVMKQNGSTADMIFPIPRLISHISSIMKLEEGDLILTGTPPGVSPVKAGQKLTAGIGDLMKMTFEVESS